MHWVAFIAWPASSKHLSQFHNFAKKNNFKKTGEKTIRLLNTLELRV